jgi:bifunctional UDP-N-acetylglucosamine pyrophosphorylase / glucosamine-1-phosphate N-acetyltransferase
MGNHQMGLNVVILAAGQGTRMRSTQAKVLHKIAGKPLLSHVIDVTRELSPDKIFVVYGHDGQKVRSTLDSEDLEWVLQEQQLGTGHAVKQALPDIDPGADILVLYGDVPLITATTLRKLIDSRNAKALSLLTANLEDPTGYGRIIRNTDNEVVGIVEEKDASPDEKKIKEINTGIMYFTATKMSTWVERLNNDNAQGEYYLTDCVGIAAQNNHGVASIQCQDIKEIEGVNNRLQLAELERAYQLRQARELMLSGTTIMDPNRIDIRGTVHAGQDCIIDVNCVFEGHVELGSRVRIGPNVLITDSIIGDDTEVLANSVIENARIGKSVSIGPFSRLRPDANLSDRVKVGNFVEIKKSNIGVGSKVNHLTYIGDTEMGCDVNIGAGTITCNYDGANKHKTIIKDNVFIGSDTQLVAPVIVGEGATIGAGSTITRDAPENKLTLSRSKQVSIEGWERPKKKEV